MTIPRNIEPRRWNSHRVGYDAYGYAWRIRGDSRNGYLAIPSRRDLAGAINAPTLKQMSERLADCVAGKGGMS